MAPTSTFVRHTSYDGLRTSDFVYTPNFRQNILLVGSRKEQSGLSQLLFLVLVLIDPKDAFFKIHFFQNLIFTF